MFSGIVEDLVPIKKVERGDNIIRLFVEKPSDFNDVKVGDSIATNGICLTVEGFFDDGGVGLIRFAIAAETLQVLGVDVGVEAFLSRPLNLERSLRFGDRLHGHLVTGHVDAVARVIEKTITGESVIIKVELPQKLKKYCWKKGSVTLNGVSLTVNSCDSSNEQAWFSVCLIPETIQKTNLQFLEKGNVINLEMDYFAKSIENMFVTSGQFEASPIGGTR